MHKSKQKIDKVLTMDYKALGMSVLEKFRRFLDDETENALLKLMAKQ